MRPSDRLFAPWSAKARRFLGFPAALRDVRTSRQSFVHSPQFLALPAGLMLSQICGQARGRLRRPDNLTILLVHNYRKVPLTERSLRLVGIEDYVVLREDAGRPFRLTCKLRALFQYVSSGQCTTKYLLYLDANDVFVRDQPGKAIDLLKGRGCDLLFSSERESYMYDGVPRRRSGWTRLPVAPVSRRAT